MYICVGLRDGGWVDVYEQMYGKKNDWLKAE